MNNVTVLYFMTTGWTCPACHGFKSHFISVCNDMNVTKYIIDISKESPDENGFVGAREGEKYNICGLPTVVVLCNGDIEGRIENNDMNKQNLISLIKQAKED